MKAREDIYAHLTNLFAKELPPNEYFTDLFRWMSKEMYISVPDDIANSDRDSQRVWALAILDRPLD